VSPAAEPRAEAVSASNGRRMGAVTQSEGPAGWNDTDDLGPDEDMGAAQER